MIGATRIFWDPSLNVDRDSSESNAAAVIAGAIVGTVVALGVIGSIGFYVINHVLPKRRARFRLNQEAPEL